MWFHNRFSSFPYGAVVFTGVSKEVRVTTPYKGESSAAKPAQHLRPKKSVVSWKRRWAWLPVLLVGVGLVVAVQQALAITQNPNLVPALLLLGALVIPVAFVAYIDGRNPAFDVPLIILVVCGLIGGVLGVVVAGLGEADTLRHLGTLPTLIVGLIEEGAKLLVPLTMLIFTRYRATIADGLLIGVAVGVGFAVLETMGYGFTTLLQSHGDLPFVEVVLLLRGLASPAGHATWTGLAAAALWRAFAQRWSLPALCRFTGVFLLVSVLHGMWDSFGFPGYLAVGILSLALLIRQLHRDLFTAA
jgi:RsiW-degrading membrane proteinase PrsW (M82 family)